MKSVAVILCFIGFLVIVDAKVVDKLPNGGQILSRNGKYIPGKNSYQVGLHDMALTISTNYSLDFYIQNSQINKKLRIKIIMLSWKFYFLSRFDFLFTFRYNPTYFWSHFRKPKAKLGQMQCWVCWNYVGPYGWYRLRFGNQQWHQFTPIIQSICGSFPKATSIRSEQKII